MEKVQYLKDKITIIWQLLFSHSYMVITQENMMAHVCDEDDQTMQNQVVLAKHKLNRLAEARTAAAE